MKKFKSLSLLFWSMFKIGLFTFGGGYAMISLFENEFVSKRKWLENEEFLDLIAIAESTPGPISINCATYIGYKTEKFWGALVATLGMCLPSFAIIYLISLFFNQFMSIAWVAAAFKGIQVCVVFLILSAGLKMFKQVEKGVLTYIIFFSTIVCMILFSLFAINFSSIFYILISGLIGLAVYCIQLARNKKTKSSDEKEDDK